MKIDIDTAHNVSKTNSFKNCPDKYLSNLYKMRDGRDNIIIMYCAEPKSFSLQHLTI